MRKNNNFVRWLLNIMILGLTRSTIVQCSIQVIFLLPLSTCVLLWQVCCSLISVFSLLLWSYMLYYLQYSNWHNLFFFFFPFSFWDKLSFLNNLFGSVVKLTKEVFDSKWMLWVYACMAKKILGLFSLRQCFYKL